MTDIPSRTTHQYRMAGLQVESDIALPMRVQWHPATDFTADLSMQLGEVPERLVDARRRGANWSVDDHHFLLDLPGIARFLASDGRRLVFSPAPGIAVDNILVFATGTALAAILYQRGALLLHGSAVVHEGQAYIFCGQSGAGKSTLAGALSQAGCGFLSDDFCSIEQTGGGQPMVQPDGRALRLYRDSIDRLNLTESMGPKIRQWIDKFHVALPEAAPDGLQGAPLAAIYILRDSSPASPPGITALQPLSAAQALLHETYRRRLALAYCDQGRLAARTTALLSHARVYQLRRPRDLTKLGEMVDMLKSHWKPGS